MGKASKRGFWIIAAALGVLLLVIGCFGYSFFSPSSKRNQQSAIACTVEWARLAPFPASARDLIIKTEGNPFTRSFRIQFSGQQPDLDRWLTNSPGLREAIPQLIGPHETHYPVTPGGGASHAEVDIKAELVSIYVSWS